MRVKWTISSVNRSWRELQREVDALESLLYEQADTGVRLSTKVAYIDARLQDTLENAEQTLSHETGRAVERDRQEALTVLATIPLVGIRRQIDAWKRELQVLASRAAAREPGPQTMPGENGPTEEPQGLDERIQELEGERTKLRRILRPRFFRWVLLLLWPELRAARATALDEYIELTVELAKLRLEQLTHRAIAAYAEQMIRFLTELGDRAAEQEKIGREAYERARRQVLSVGRRLAARPYDFTLYILAEARRAEGDREGLEAASRRVREALLQGRAQAEEIVRQTAKACRKLYRGITRINLIERLYQLKTPTESLEQFFSRIARRYTMPFTGLNELILGSRPLETRAFALPYDAREELHGIEAAEYHEHQKIVALLGWHRIPIFALTCAAQTAAAVERREQEGKRPAFPQRDWQMRYALNYHQPWDAERGNWLLLGLAGGLIRRVGQSRSWYEVNGERVNGLRRVESLIRADFKARQAILGHWRRLFQAKGVEGVIQALEGAKDLVSPNGLERDLEAVIQTLKEKAPASPQEFESILLFTRSA